MTNSDLKDIFWKQYINADEIERLNKMEAPASMIESSFTIKDEKLRSHAINSLLQSYFDDLIEYMENINRRKPRRRRIKR